MTAWRGSWSPKTLSTAYPPSARRPSGRTAGAYSESTSLIEALRAHVATLKEQLAAAEGKAGEEANALREHNATLKADVEKLDALLAAERERADKAITGFEALLRTESERADRGLAAFESLAERLEEIAAARRPWWRRLVG
jgi:chromosome segregation ATPase